MSSSSVGQFASLSGAMVARVAAPLREQVEELLRRAIVSQEFPAGSRLVERELVERLGVSRTTVREALRHLAAEGLVKTIPQKGLVVALPTREESVELYELRAMLEAFVARRFAERASEEQVRRLREDFSRAEATLLAPEPSPLQEQIEAKNRLYQTLVTGAGNQTIRAVLEQLQARISVLRATSLSLPGRSRTSAEEIRQLVEAIEARDPDAAAAAASKHVQQAARALFAALDAEPPSDGAAPGGRRPTGDNDAEEHRGYD